MKKSVNFTNEEILHLCHLFSDFNANQNIYFPAKLNYYIQYNMKQILDIGMEVENIRMEVAKHYGEKSNDGKESYIIKPENFDAAQNELMQLSKATREVDIYFVSLDDFENITLTSNQMQALMFMIEEP